MFLKKFESLLERIPALVETQLSSDPKKRCKPCGIKQIRRFKSAFVCFYFLVGLLSWGIIFYCSRPAISRYFSGPKLPEYCETQSSEQKNMYHKNFLFDFHAFLSEKDKPNFESETQPIWTKRNVAYFDDSQSDFRFSMNVSISEVSQEMIRSKWFEIYYYNNYCYDNNPERITLNLFLGNPKSPESLPARLPDEKRLARPPKEPDLFSSGKCVHHAQIEAIEFPLEIKRFLSRPRSLLLDLELGSGPGET